MSTSTENEIPERVDAVAKPQPITPVPALDPKE